MSTQVIYRNRNATSLNATSSSSVVAIPTPSARVAPAGPQGFGLRLKWIREQAGITRLEQDRYAALTAGHSSNIEAGRRALTLDSRSLARLARVYGTTMDWLYLGVGSPPSRHEIEASIDVADSKLRDVTEAVIVAREKLRVL